jgi:hypothetical protein
MGQQQLLLLVLSTVIVGLATVSGIQAFDENQQKATQDALVQRAMSIGSDILAAHQEPSQFGGVNLSASSNKPSASDIATAAGFDSTTPSADGAGDQASCTISFSSKVATVVCSSDGSGSKNASTNQSVTVEVDPTADPSVSTKKINNTSI